MNTRIKKIITDRERLENWLSTAMIDSPWFDIIGYDKPMSKGEIKGTYVEEKWVDALLNGGHIIVSDIEEEKEHKINLENFIKGFGKFIFDSPEQYANLMTDNYDFYDADALLQTVVFSEVIYG